MKKLAALLAATLSGALTLLAATPVAVWDGDFTATQTGFTLNRSGNAISQDNSTITIDQSVGVKVDFTTGLSDAMTVMFKYSDLAFDAQKTLVTSFCSGGDENRTGVYAASGGTINGIWNTADWGNASQTLSESSGILAFCYHKSNGTSLYYINTDGSRIELFNKSGLKASGDAAINGCTIGGERAKSGATLLGAATGMKITGIAIFDSILTEAEMTGYIWPSEIQTIDVNANMSVSAINAQYDSTTYKVAKVTVASGLTITVDEAFSEKIQSVSSAGSITLSAASQPDASYFANVDFSGVQGGLLRSWLTPGVVGFNFRSASGTDVSGALATTDNWIHDNNSASGTSTAMFADGLSTLKWSSANTWACSGSTIISGYLDDGANGGNGATVTLSNVPYETYDVIVYCSSDTANGDFLAKTVNGTTYTWDSTAGAVVVGNSTWGKAALSTPVYGVNALRIKNLSGPLTIYGLAKDGNSRGGIAAIEIMPPNTPDNIRTYTLTLSGTATTWSAGTWTLNGQTVDAPASGYVEIVASASTALTVDQEVSLTDLKVRGGENIVVNIANNNSGSLYAIRATVESGVFQQGSPAVLGATPSIVVASGATFDENGMAVNAANAVTIAGAGAGNWPWALTSSSGAGGAILGGLYLSANATIGGVNELKVGQTGAGYYCHLRGFTLTKTGVGAFTATNMNTPGTGTIDVQGGAMSVNQWNNLNSGSGDTDVILRSGTSLENKTDRVISMRTLTLDGGTLLTTSNGFKVKTILTGQGETAKLSLADGATINLTGELKVSSELGMDGSLTISTEGINPEEIAVGQTINLLTAPSETTLSADTITVKASSRYDTTISGNTVTATVRDALSNPFLHYDFENGAAVDTGKASDSRTQIYAFGENSNPLFVNGRKGKAVRIRTPGCTPYWDTNVSSVSPFAVGEVTVTTVAKMKETGVALWGLGNTNNSNPAMGLVASNSTSVAVVARNASGVVETILTIEGTSDLTRGYHFFAVVANANGTTLYVDELSASTDKTISFEIGQQGQLGSFHGGVIGASKVGADGYYLDDWRVYDAALTAKEIKVLKRELNPDPLYIRLR